MKKRVFASLALTVILVSPGWAHHNMTAIFDFDQRFTRTGTLIQTDWRNPHIGLSVDAQGDQAPMVTWSFEGPSPKFFRVRGISKSHFENAIGETVTVEASRARDGSLSGLIRMITLPDGTVVSLCPQNC